MSGFASHPPTTHPKPPRKPNPYTVHDQYTKHVAWNNGRIDAEKARPRTNGGWLESQNKQAYNEGYDSYKGETQMTNKVTVKTCAQETAKEPTINSIKPGTIFRFQTGTYYFIKAESGRYVRLHDGALITINVDTDTIVCPLEAGKCVEIQVQ